MTPVHGVPAEKSQGAVPGKYKVIISKLVTSDGNPIPPEVSQADAMQQGAKESLSPKYSSEATTVLTATVEKGPPQESLDFLLK